MATLLIVRLGFFLFIMSDGSYNYSLMKRRDLNCELLEGLLRYNKAKQTFSFDQYKDSLIVFVDMNFLFKDCDIASYYGRKIMVVHDSSYLKIASESNIVITSLIESSRGYRMSIYYKIRNGFFTVEFRRKNKNLIATKLTGGYF